MKKNKKALWIFLGPAILSFCIMFLYPVLITVGMSFNKLGNIADPMSAWKFVGLSNYQSLFETRLFIVSLKNIAGIWILGGILSLLFAMLFAVILTSGVKLKGFWRAMIYLPNVISGVAMGTMWVQYVYSAKFGLLKTVLSAVGLKKLSLTQWTSPKHIFVCMIVAFSFGIVGYFMLMLIAGIERIPISYYEAATLEGAGVYKRFFSITLPLLMDVIKSVITLWTVTVVGFFVWSQMFTPFDIAEGTVTPMIYMYQQVFGSSFGTAERNVGGGAAIGVVLALIVVGVFTAVNICIKDSDLEF
ncbi:MAG: sugar ABC transporter permease [Oscillospiraceae bacterium]